MLSPSVGLFAIVTFGMVLGCRADAEPEIRPGRQAVSPDGKLAVIYDPSADHPLQIVDSASGAVQSSFPVLPVHALRWTGDSKTLIVVQHIAHGSEAEFLH